MTQQKNQINSDIRFFAHIENCFMELYNPHMAALYRKSTPYFN